MTGVTIRAARPEEWAAVAALHAASWASAYRGLMSDAYLDGPVLADRQAVWRRRLGEGGDGPHVTVVADDGELAGLCCILPRHDPDWNSLVDNLHVRPGGTRGRLGRRLVAAAAALLPPEAADVPLHLTVLAGNARAIGAYESWGGRRVATLKTLEPDDQDLAVHRYVWDNPAALIALC